MSARRGPLQRLQASRIYGQRHTWAVLALAAAATGLYLLTLTDRHTFDAVTYAALAENPDLPGSLVLLLQPHHLGYHVLSHLTYRLWLLLGWQGRSMLPLQVLSALLAGLGLVLFGRLLSRFVRGSVVLVTLVLLAIVHGYWLFGVSVEVYSLSFAMLTLAAYGSFELQRTGSQKAAFWAGVGLALAILAHVMNALFFVVLLGAVLLAPAETRGRRFRLFLIASAVTGVLVLVPYGLAILVLRLDSWREISYWLTLYAHTGRGGDVRNRALHLTSLQLAVQGLRDFFIALKPDLNWLLNLLLLAPVALWGALALRANRRVAGLCLLWLALYGAFITWWSPAGELWMPLVPPVLILLALAVNRVSGRPGRLVLAGLLVFAAVAATLNWRNGVSNPQRQVIAGGEESARAIAACVDPGEEVITTTALYPLLSYYGGLKPISFDLVFYLAEMQGREGVKERAVRTLQETIEEALDQDRSIWITGEVLNGNGVSAKHGVGPGEIQSLLAPYHLERTTCAYTATYLPGSPSFDLYRIGPPSTSRQSRTLPLASTGREP
ncbi:MAG: hypothetical protein P8129_07110 [Anaerolineae bacterium]